MDDRAIRSPDFKPVQLGKRGPDSHGSCGSKFPRLEPAAQTAQTSDSATLKENPMQTQWTRGAQPHSFQKRARATLARLELAA